MEDPEKVKKILDQLNKESKSTDWDDVSNLFMMPQAAYDPSTKSYNVNADTGVTVKFFINTKTGELKPYWIGKLAKD